MPETKTDPKTNGELPADLNPELDKNLTADEKQYLSALLSNATVCSVLSGAGDKIMAARIQAKLAEDS